MRFNLYEAEIERRSGWSKTHVVAPSEQRAAELVFDHDMAFGQQHLRVTLERVDESLSGDRCKGPDDMLENSPVGIASYKSNQEFWEEKFRVNLARDRRNVKSLESIGWRTFEVWECDLKKKGPEEVAKTLRMQLMADS